ncbi:Pr6Pr family membrane protein [Agreia sp. VKM Ac-1783]|uniref:Pr6Pr family membrane protein n=1 Tax=Agreia sp. VKM Ac-1783 TaxID=1938889 RepID=UPI000A2ACD26|nr:Pr6Pr family membrane protein [Agreia sp. VKM Ac-1783]SMQ68087.1 hypothetical protein SAMN06295943_1520 [Agreia sp. VKM Ac-1783]
MRILFAALRAAVAIAIVAAIVGQLLTSLAFWSDRGVTNIGSNVVNFFSFFTIESNVAAVAVLAVGAGLLATRSGDDPEWFQVTRAAVVSYMVVTGVVYNLLLRGIELPQGATLGWSNEIVHAVAPAYLLLDWILAPGRRAIPARRIGTILVYPLVWVVYTLVRAPFVTDQVYKTDYWYPYPFLNPNTSAQGYISVAFYVVLIAAVIGLTAAGVLWISRRGGVARAEFRQAS